MKFFQMVFYIVLLAAGLLALLWKELPDVLVNLKNWNQPGKKEEPTIGTRKSIRVLGGMGVAISLVCIVVSLIGRNVL